jgi:hypothetical protein
MAVLTKALDAAEARLGSELPESFREAYEDAVNREELARSAPNDLTLFHPSMFRKSGSGIVVGTRGDDLLTLEGEALFVAGEMIAPTLGELVATDSSGYDGTDVVEVVCPFCGSMDQITIDSSGGSSQTFVEDCASCCHPRVVHVEGGAVRVERA